MRKRLYSKLRLSLLFLLVIALVLTASSCTPVADDYAASYLDEYSLPSFDKAKLREVEWIYMK